MVDAGGGERQPRRASPAETPQLHRPLAANDGGGECTAALSPVIGRTEVARLFSRLAASRDGGVTIAIRDIKLFPTAVIEFPAAQGRRPPRIALSVDVDDSGLIAGVRVIAS